MPLSKKPFSTKTRTAIGLGLIGVVAPCAAAVLAGPPATGASDPCSASEVARTIGSVAKSMGDYLDAHPETNQAMTAALQQQAGPQSLATLKSYLDANPKVSGDMQTIAQPLTGLSTQCKLPITMGQAMGLMQQAQGAGGLPSLPGGAAGTPSTGPKAAGSVPTRANNAG
jgi:hemophore